MLLRGDGGRDLFLLLGRLVNRALGLPGAVHALGLVRALSPGERTGGDRTGVHGHAS